jgi:hypothetical protein
MDDLKIKPGDALEYFTQEHRTTRSPNRTHYDFRMGSPDRGLYSWAIPKARFPDIGEKLLAVQTPIHNYDYGRFSGVLEKGYGAGRVDLREMGKAQIHKYTPNKQLSFTLNRNNIPMRYTLIKSNNDNEWIIIGVDPRKDISKQTIKVKKVKGNDKPLGGSIPQ